MAVVVSHQNQNLSTDTRAVPIHMEPQHTTGVYSENGVPQVHVSPESPVDYKKGLTR